MMAAEEPTRLEMLRAVIKGEETPRARLQDWVVTFVIKVLRWLPRRKA